MIQHALRSISHTEASKFAELDSIGVKKEHFPPAAALNKARDPHQRAGSAVRAICQVYDVDRAGQYGGGTEPGTGTDSNPHPIAHHSHLQHAYARQGEGEQEGQDQGGKGQGGQGQQEQGGGGGQVARPDWLYMVKNTLLLSCCYGIGLAMLFTNVGTTTGAAKALKGTSLSTVPFGLLLAGCTISAFVVQRQITLVGARLTFFSGGLVGVLAGGAYLAAVRVESFVLLCLGAFLSGYTNSTINFLRFEVTQFVAARPQLLPLGISAVVGGGVAGAVVGPMLTQHTRRLTGHDFEGTYIFLLALFALEAILILLVDFERAPKAGPRPQFLRIPAFSVGVAGGALSFSAMAGLMLAFPLAMQAVQPDGSVDFTKPSERVLTFDDSSNTLLAHFVVMFFPSFFMHSIITRIGTEATVAGGMTLLLAGTATFAGGGTSRGAFYAGAVLLGAGWNLAYVGATAQVAALHRTSEKETVRGFNDFVIFFMNTLTAASASAILRALNSWRKFLVLYLVYVGASTVLVTSYWLWTWRQRRRLRRRQGASSATPC
eukprot:jgi/Mesen1/6500/ME000332S05506